MSGALGPPEIRPCTTYNNQIQQVSPAANRPNIRDANSVNLRHFVRYLSYWVNVFKFCKNRVRDLVLYASTTQRFFFYNFYLGTNNILFYYVYTYTIV